MDFHNPFTVGANIGAPATPTGEGPMSTEGSFAQHGSAEQNTPGFNFSSMTPPRTPRVRSPAADGMDHGRPERSREARRQGVSEPVGGNFRLIACESTLKDHTNELAAQRLTIAQLTEALQRVSIDKEAQDTRLNEVFQHVDVKFTEAMNRTQILEDCIQQTQGVTANRIETLTLTISNVSQGLAQRLEAMMLEIEVMRRNPLSAPEPPRAPAPPQSWSAAPPAAEPHLPQRNWAECPLQTPPGMEAPRNPFVGTASTPSRPTGAAFHHIGSPLGGNAPQGPNDGVPHDQRFPSPNFGHAGATPAPEPPHFSMARQYTPGAGTELQPFDPRSWSTDGKKVTKELRTYDGDMARYDNWRRRIRDHFVNTNHNYSKIFDLVEGTKVPIKWATLSTAYVQELPFLDWQWVATHIWTFTANYLNDTQIERRGTLCMGEEFNGLELWRTLFRENCGGSVQLANLERGHFIAFPKCDKASELRIHLGQ